MGKRFVKQFAGYASATAKVTELKLQQLIEFIKYEQVAAIGGVNPRGSF